MTRNIIGVVLVIFGGLTGALLLAADKVPEKYALNWKLEKGQKRAVTYDLSVAGEVKVTTFGRHPLMKFSSKVSREFTEQALDIKKSASGEIEALKVKREYAKSSLTALEPKNPNAAMDPGPEEKEEVTKPDALDKQALEISYSSAVSDKGALQPTIPGSNSGAAGAIKLPEYEKDKGLSINPVTKPSPKAAPVSAVVISDDTKKLVLLQECDFGLFMPNQKMAVGDEWEVKSDAIARVLSLQDGRPIRYVHMSPEVGMRFNLQNSTVKCVFTEIATIDNTKCAKITVSGKVNAIQDEMLNNEITLSGVIYYALNKNVVQKVELDGEMVLAGEYPGRTTDKGMALRCKVEGRGKMTLRLQMK